MGKGSESTWIYGFGVDFRNADSSSGHNGNYIVYKWCAPVSSFGDTLNFGGALQDLTRARLPNLYSGFDLGEHVANVNMCNTSSSYENGSIPASCGSQGYNPACTHGSTNLVAILGGELSLLGKFEGQLSLLDIQNTSDPPSFVMFESLTGKAILYSKTGKVLNYEKDGSFRVEDFVPLDIVLRRSSSKETFDLISVYPLSGEIIHYTYGTNDEVDISSCGGGHLSCFNLGGKTYKRHTIEDEIKLGRS